MSAVERKTLMQTGLATQGVRAGAATRRWICHVVRDGVEQQPISLGARPVVVGAGRDCDLVLRDDQVSRRHAELQATHEGVRVRDLGSTNGSFWQGSRITEVIVPIGATVRVGSALLRFSPGEVPTVPPSERRRFGGLVGRSLAMRELFAVLELASPTDATVLIEGESGTGKELAARALHDHSERATVPMVVVDCSAVSDQLLDSHLFGHVRGAFTGAVNERKGAFVEADGGTLFLDEIGELSLPSQAKLLRALEDQTVQPVGADRRVAVDTRVIAATHRDLSRMVREQTFRFDLFYRLAVVHASIPPLRERPEDIDELVNYFYEGRPVPPGPIEGDNLERLRHYSWPGNVRELRNALERAWALGGAGGVRFGDLRLFLGGAGHSAPAEVIDTSLPFKDAKQSWVDVFERRYLASVFEQHARNITHAAEHAGINRRHFRELLRKHGIIE
jgi:transcriptional regulator with GAF, ATPase, and Fis domain